MNELNKNEKLITAHSTVPQELDQRASEENTERLLNRTPEKATYEGGEAGAADIRMKEDLGFEALMASVKAGGSNAKDVPDPRVEQDLNAEINTRRD